ncbi:efflux RND transporter periplasmic adaptor subunit [Roseomonas sp. GC11]|uniref:efflux RND transporter periplasmic adaptor subunit n=1 Tax=Roseomonas sp. GC11 TaxID=2950546 RepID=UPI00210CB8F8|nr:efflux RND transporter periplasmic adaptor subunit [Roseomonas sp. GC11]MCQ4161373.1 efflux RND transporter periplasmic adaptor subunit [Roseomonas sp. GC11]
MGLLLLAGAGGLAGGLLAIPASRAALLGPATAALGTIRDRFAGDPAMEKPDPVRGVRVVAVAEAPARLEKSFTGTVAARYETALGFRVGGKILRRAVELGQSVQAGELLFLLDPADYRAALAAAGATLAAAQAQAVQTAAEERRQAQLLAQGWASQAAYERARAAAQVAANQARAAAEQLELARNDLSYTELRAPHEGIVTALRAEAGQVVALGQAVLTLVRPGEREAVVSVPEGQVADLAAWSATARFWGRDAAPEAARLREIAPQADPASRTYAVRFSLPASAGSAELGSTVTIHLTREGAGTVARLPATAVLFRQGQPVVWRLEPGGEQGEGRVRAVPVSLLRLGAETAEVGGLATGERIVTLGVHRLDEGARVRVVEGPGGASLSTAGAARGQGGRS